MGALLVGIVLLDITTLGQHLAMMRENLCPAKEHEKKLVSNGASKWRKRAKNNSIAKKKLSITPEEETGKAELKKDCCKSGKSIGPKNGSRHSMSNARSPGDGKKVPIINIDV